MSVQELDLSRRVSTRRDVALLRWPAEEQMRATLDARGVPRLLLVSRGCDAPVCVDELEDWVRDPLDPAELDVRAATLEERARLREVRPWIDPREQVRVGQRTVGLPPIQLAVARELIERFGEVVPAERIQAAALSGGGSTHPKAVNAVIIRVKRRLGELDLVLTNVRDRGYLLEAVPPGPTPEHAAQRSERGGWA